MISLVKMSCRARGTPAGVWESRCGIRSTLGGMSDLCRDGIRARSSGECCGTILDRPLNDRPQETFLEIPVGADDERQAMRIGHEASLQAPLEVPGIHGNPSLQLGHRFDELQRIEGVCAVDPAAQRPPHETERVRPPPPLISRCRNSMRFIMDCTRRGSARPWKGPRECPGRGARCGIPGQPLFRAGRRRKSSASGLFPAR